MTSVHADGVPVIIATPGSLNLALSMLEIWVGCPGSAWISAVLREGENAWNTEGTAAHAILTYIIEHEQCRPEDLIGLDWVVGKNDKGEITHRTDREMVEHGEQSAETIRGQLCWIVDGKITTEIPVEYSYGDFACRGRYDVAAHDGDTIAVIDYKYGRGELVPAVGRLQNVGYLLALRQKIGRRQTYYAGILQPRSWQDGSDQIKWWILTDGELNQVEKTIQAAIDRAKYFPPSFTTGPHCKWCPGKLVCPAVGAECIHAMVTAKGWDGRKPNTWILDRIDDMRSYFKRMESETFKVLSDGGEVPGYCLVDYEGNRKWIDRVDSLLIREAESKGWTKDDVIKSEEKPIAIGAAEKLGLNTAGMTEKPKKTKIEKTKNAKPENVRDALRGF